MHGSVVGDSRIARWLVEAPPDWRIGRLGFAVEAGGRGSTELVVRDQIETAPADVVIQAEVMTPPPPFFSHRSQERAIACVAREAFIGP
jgi:hypothetical protein